MKPSFLLQITKYLLENHEALVYIAVTVIFIFPYVLAGFMTYLYWKTNEIRARENIEARDKMVSITMQVAESIGHIRDLFRGKLGGQ